MKPRSYRRVSNSLKLDFDPLTWDALKDAARQRGENMERTAYLAIQAVLAAKAADPQPATPDPDYISVDTSSFAALRQRDEREIPRQS